MRIVGSGIYRITNTVTSECYIGQSVRIQKRWSEHRRLLRAGSHHSRKLQESWKNHGEGAFTFALIRYASVEELDAIELEFVSRELPALNMRIDGILGCARGRKLSERAKAKLRGRKLTPEHRANISAAQTGIRRSAEACEAISAGKRQAIERRAAAGLPAAKKGTDRARRKDSKLSREQVLLIRSAWTPRNRGGGKMHGPSIREIGNSFGVSYMLAWKAIHGVRSCAFQ